MSAFGEWLAERRQARRLTQEEAAARAGMTRAMWAKLESGASGTRRATVPRIATALDVNLDETYRRAGYSPSEETDLDFAKDIANELSRVPVALRENFKQKIRNDAASLAAMLRSIDSNAA